ncbi:MAG TPA: pyridoxamine 5'-phosphate oxidase family protein [Candidatus Dormibacteraeota bacterium]
MGLLEHGIDAKLKRWIEKQHLFFVATAPAGGGGHVNLSPKGRDSLRVVDAWTLAYVDLTGSGVETISHVRENGRITLMLCAFEGAPRIVRIHGRGRVVERSHEDWDRWIALFATFRAVRSVIAIEAERVSDSCGYGVPLMAYESERTQMDAWADRKGQEGIDLYQKDHNVSLDGLPGLREPGLKTPAIS